jgi:HD domain
MNADRRLLPVMPLHAITTQYGGAGLRERLKLEIARLPSVADRERVNRALELAARLHAADRRQREPYLNHLLRVAIRIISHYHVLDADVICAALLHDAIEDHADELSPDGRPGALAVLAGQFGSRVAELVAAVTNPVYAPGRDADQQYREHVAGSLAACPWARVIKVSDFTDNGVGLIHSTGPKTVKLARKYAPLVPVLRDLITRPDTPLDDDVRARIVAQLRSAEERFAAIAGATGP